MTEIYDYENILDGIKYYSDKGNKIWVSPECSFFIYNAITNKVDLNIFLCFSLMFLIIPSSEKYY